MNSKVLIQALIFPGVFILVFAITQSAWYLNLDTNYKYLFAALSVPLGFALSRSSYVIDPMPKASRRTKMIMSILFGALMGIIFAFCNYMLQAK